MIIDLGERHEKKPEAPKPNRQAQVAAKSSVG
jgi:hypothetical protein